MSPPRRVNWMNCKSEVLTERDENGWQVLHQGVAGGNPDVVKLLVSNGADINARTHGGYGETPLRIAEKRLGHDNPIVSYLKRMGALSIGPEL
jgi:ankyrin repeat protein